MFCGSTSGMNDVEVDLSFSRIILESDVDLIAAVICTTKLRLAVCLLYTLGTLALCF
jgi:hypothetical protein